MKTIARILFYSSMFCSIMNSSSAQPKPIPKNMFWLNKPVFSQITSDSIIIEAGPKTDIFYSPDGNHKINNSPRLLFPADSVFIFKAKLDVGFKTNWDAGILYFEFDENTWSKLCFEKDYQGRNRIVSVVTRSSSDDCNSDIITSDQVYLQIARNQNTFSFYYSPDGEKWHLIRSFEVDASKPLNLGFMAQSPAGQGCQVAFSEISYHAKRLIDFWEGI